ncbi:hypothetical protein GCM10022215_19240 [Nocardioides fonticola]|uniref:Uncharacterized protein n=1 Tax=Nocardioides fonticola TaxID=450363 RepID=A0ABP7XJ05_9ACTN
MNENLSTTDQREQATERPPWYRRSYPSSWFGSLVLQPVGAATLGVLILRLLDRWVA